MTISADALRAVQNRASLFAFLRDELHWPVDPQDTFTYSGPSLSGEVAQRAEVSRIVPFGANDPWAIMLVEFATTFRRSDMREILRGIRAEVRSRAAYEARPPEAFVFVCATESFRGIRFAHFEQREGKQPKLSVFGWDRNDPQGTRTLRDVNLPSLTMPPRNVLDEVDWPSARWGDAWNVEKVTGDFFRRYEEVFRAFLPQIEGVSDEAERWSFGQQLFSRIMFCWFLQKKGWLNRQHNYVRELWRNAQDHAHSRPHPSHPSYPSYYTDLLRPLFFEVLNVPPEQRPSDEEHERLMTALGDVPYLNGGLFDPRSEWDRSGAVRIANEAFEPLLNLFEDYRFTIDESTPDDIEVAVDPEMLGKVFEELVTGRHESGSYYTPRPVVAFMCRESLKGYLSSACAAETPDVVEQWVDGDDDGATQLHNPEAMLEALKRVRVCDPACGSGAYLLGMMQELLRLRQSLFRANVRDHKLVHDRKLEIIERNLYGVDISQFAVNTARLRLWLSLVVDDERHPLDDPGVFVALPNLDFRIERGDSLTAPDPQISDTSDLFREKDIELFEQAKGQYGDPSFRGDKPALLGEIGNIRQRIAAAEHGGRPVPHGAFDWRVEFAEVFLSRHPEADIGGGFNLGGTLTEAPRPGGFDIVLANPPYVRQELIRDQKPALRQVYGDFYCGTADLYCYFYARGLQLLRPGGMFVYISSNKWFRAAYGEKLRRLVADTCSVLSITDFGELPVFQTAATFPMIFVAMKGGRGPSPVLTQVSSLDSPYPDVRSLVAEQGQSLPVAALSGPIWTLTGSSADLVHRMDRAGMPLDDYVGGRIYRGVVTCCNPAFFIDGPTHLRLIEDDPRSAEIIKPLIVGDDVRRWRIDYRERWLVYAPWHLDIDQYPAVKEHLAQWKKELVARAECRDGKYNWWCLSRYASDYYQEFSKPKIVYPDIGKEPRFALDASAAYINDMTFMISACDPFLLAVLNSDAVWQYVKQTCAVLSDASRGGRVRLKRIYASRIPIPAASDTDRGTIAALAQKCIDAGGVGCEAWEAEIDERVAALYGL